MKKLKLAITLRGTTKHHRVAEITRRHFFRDVMRDCLIGQGYAVDGESKLPHAAELRLTRPDWEAGYCAEVWVDRHGAVHGRIVGESSADGYETSVRDHTYCAGFNADIMELGRRLGADVVVSDGYVSQGRE